MARVANFSAGPCTLPETVLLRAQADLLDFRQTGISVMELSHRSPAFESIIENAESALRRLTGLPHSHRILFLQGGASLQFSMLPLSRPGGRYVVTGAWGRKAVEAARLAGPCEVIYDSEANGDRDVPDALPVLEGHAYVHTTSNETISGVQYDPIALDVSAPLVIDASSDFLAAPRHYGNAAMTYAGAQKNLGPAGLTVVLISEEFLGGMPEKTHPMLDYRLQAKNGSLYNTPPCWSIYVAGLVLEWMEEVGGLPEMARRAEVRSSAIYAEIDASDGFYVGHAVPRARSKMNVTFNLPSPELAAAFVREASEAQMVELGGHRSVGGIRASMYNAMPESEALRLAEFMREFRSRH